METDNLQPMPSYKGYKIVRSGANLTPRIINTFFLLSLQHYFISHPEYHWDPDDNKTEIDIHPEYEEDDNIDKGLPVIVVQSGPVVLNPIGIGTGMSHIEPRYIKYKDRTAKLAAVLDSQLQIQVDGSIYITVIGMSNDDVNELAFDIGMFLMMIKYSAASVLQVQNIGAIQVTQAQAESKTGWTNRHVARISIPYVFTVTRVWKPYNAGELIKEIQTNIITKTTKLKHKVGFKPAESLIQPGNDYENKTILDKTLPDIEQIVNESSSDPDDIIKDTPKNHLKEYESPYIGGRVHQNGVQNFNI